MDQRTFGEMYRNVADLENALEVKDIPPTRENVAKLFNIMGRYEMRERLQEAQTAAGWDVIYGAIDENFEKEEIGCEREAD